MSLKVEDLRDILENALEQLKSFNDDDTVKITTNTYFVKDSEYLAIAGKGFVGLSDIEVKEVEDESEYE